MSISILTELYSFLYETFNGKERLKAKNMREVRFQMVKKGPEEVDRKLLDTGMASYFSTDQVLLHFLVKDEERI